MVKIIMKNLEIEHLFRRDFLFFVAAIVLIASLGFSAHAHEVGPAKECVEILDSNPYLFYLLKTQDLLRQMKDSIGEVQAKPVSKSRLELVSPRSWHEGNNIGYIDYFVYVNEGGEKILDIEYLYTQGSFKNKGVAKLLLGLVLAMNPEVKEISGELRDVNMRRYGIGGYDTDAERLEAIKRTPAYKLRTFYGFTEWDPAEPHYFNVNSFRMRKP